MRTFVHYLFILTFLFSCEYHKKNKEKADRKNEIKDGVVKTYHPNGKLRAEVTFVEGKKNGVAKDYYASNGKLHLELPYKDGLREGVSKMYYETGILYSETPYKNDKIDGVKKKYREDGKLAAEIPYRNGEVCAGLKEYLLDGSPKKEYPTIVVTPIDQILSNDRYMLRFTLSKKARKVKFYVGNMKDQCSMDNLEFVREVSPGTSQLEYFIPRGRFVMEQINIVAKFTTILDNECIIQRKYNLAADHR